MVNQEGEATVDPMERLMAQMSKMAATVNEFRSPEVQLAAFRALMDEYDGATPAPKAQKSVLDPVASDPAETPTNGSRPEAKKRLADGKRSHASAAVRADATLDTRPEGVQSLNDFIEGKKPRASQEERNVAFAYWLSEIAKHPKVTAAQIAACYLAMNWREPANMRNSLQVTASVKRWLNTKDADDIKVTVPGRNFVRHDLPRPTPAP